jgi:glutamate--cysteine ligase
MYFVKRGDTYHDVSGASFRDLLAGRLPALPGMRATLSDWSNHLTTIFPEVRLKRYLEMRGADAGPVGRLCALPAFWTGLYYDETALEGALQLVKDWSAADRQKLRDEVPRLGFGATVHRRRVLDVARDAVALAAGGLARRARLNSSGEDESRFLDPLREMLEDERTLADRLLADFAGRWGGSVEPVFRELAL